MTRTMMTTTMTVVATLTMTSACLFGEVRNVPCAADGDCPETYFCDVPRTECRETTDAFGAPFIQIQNVLDTKGDEVRSPFIPPETTSILTMLPNNIGLSTAEDFGVSFGELECFEFNPDESSIPASIDAGAQGQIKFEITPQAGCASLFIVDWFLTFSGRETRGVFDINVKEP